MPPEIHASWNALPGFLINIVFASLFLGVSAPGLKTIWKIAAPQLCFGQIMAWGQYVFAGILVFLVLGPLYHVNDGFAALLEIGFEGGHGTVAGLSQTFEDFHWTDGRELGFTVATIGMIVGVVLGMCLVNMAVRKKWVSNIRSFQDQSPEERRGIIRPEDQPPAGRQTVFADSIDSLALHVAVVGLAVTIGYLLK